MKILLINNFYYNRGGDCTYLFSLKKLLEEKGHKVIVFSMRHPRNFESEYSKYFVNYINYAEEVKNQSLSSGFNVLYRTIYSLEAKRNMERLIEQEKPDIAHLQNIHHHITPSILYPLKKHNIPVVWTLHDYTIICPNTLFLSQDRICERCKKTKYFWPSVIRCKKNSFLASTMAAIENTVHRIMKVYDLVDVFIAPSEFLRNKFIEYGFKEQKIMCIGYLIDIELQDDKKPPGDYYMYVGRISEEKGIKTLIDAAVDNPGEKLKIIGSGPLKKAMELYAASKDKNRTIAFLGHKRRDEVIEYIKNCRFAVVPSEWYENYPFSVLETFACGKPVIGSKIGGIPELVKDNETGLTFEIGNSYELSKKIKYLENNPEAVIEMGRNARAFVERELNADKHYRKLMEIYKRLML